MSGPADELEDTDGVQDDESHITVTADKESIVEGETAKFVIQRHNPTPDPCAAIWCASETSLPTNVGIATFPPDVTTIFVELPTVKEDKVQPGRQVVLYLEGAYGCVLDPDKSFASVKVRDYVQVPVKPANPTLVVPGAKIFHAKNTSGSGHRSQHDFKALNECWLDFWMMWGPKFDWEVPTNPGPRVRQSGKIPGMATIGNPDLKEGNNGTGNTGPRYPEAWSARSGFGEFGTVSTYLYDQLRPSGAGGRKLAWKQPWPNGPQFKFGKGIKYRITQRIKINTPAKRDGHLEMWVDGERVFLAQDMCWRGDTSTNKALGRGPKYDAAKAALIDSFKFHSYYGGNPASAPVYDSWCTFGDFYILDAQPDFKTTWPG